MRWVTLVVAAAATIQAFRTPVETGSRQTGWDKYLMLAVDLQALFGFILYFGLSPYTTEAMANMGSVLRTPAVRYWAVVHAGGMFAAVILVRMGRVLALSAASGAAARNRRVLCFALATGIMVAAIPWPGLSTGRPLFRIGWPRLAASHRLGAPSVQRARTDALSPGQNGWVVATRP